VMLKSTVRSRSIGTFSGMSGIDIDGALPNGFDRNQNGWHFRHRIFLMIGSPRSDSA